MASDNSKQSPQTPNNAANKPNHLQKITQRKQQLKALSKSKKLEKLAAYSSCKVSCAVLLFAYNFILYCQMFSCIPCILAVKYVKSVIMRYVPIWVFKIL